MIDGAIAGFAEMEPNGHIDRFFVSADHQRQGVGRAMMKVILAQAQRVGIPGNLRAEVSLSARPFFESQGFVASTSQEVVVRGVTIRNVLMARTIR